MVDAVQKLEKIIRNLAKKNAYPIGLIQVYRDDNNLLSIEINGQDWSNQLTFAEAEDAIYCLFKGIELGKENMRSKYVFK